MIDHTGISVRDFQASRAFYTAALAPIGYGERMAFSAAEAGGHEVAGFGEPDRPDFWISAGEPTRPAVHVAFRVRTRDRVDAFHAAALAAGGRDNGAPGLRPHYHPAYYAAFVLDPDGHNVEVVCHEPA